jgi:hypothetical protein
VEGEALIIALDRTIDLVALVLPPELVSPDALKAVRTVAETLPHMASGGALECRLGPDPRVDLLMYMLKDEGGYCALLRDAEARGLFPQFLVHWQRILDFCRDWADPDSVLHTEVPALWLEFDVEDDPTGTLPIPFPCIEKHITATRPPEVQGEHQRAKCLEVTERALSLLHGRSITTLGPLGHCIERLPPRGRALHIAPLLTRGINATRLVCTLPVTELPAYLSDISWPGSIAQLNRLLIATTGRENRIGFHLDVGMTIHPTIGLEIYYPPGDARWRPLLDYLCSLRACTPEKRDALLRWPAAAQVALPHHRWPTRLSTGLLVKLVLKQEILEAKAYLGFTPLHPLLQGIDLPAIRP